MRSRIAGLCAAVCLTALPVAHGQAAAGFEPPRTSWGAPDLQGNWTNASITRMTRPAGVDALVLTPEQAKALEDGDFNNARTQAELRPTDQTVGAPAKAASLPGLGNYNAVWVDAGSKVAVVNGELRSSWIVDPPSGRIPYKGDRGAARPAPKPVKAASAKPSARPAGKSSGQDKNAFVDAVAPPPARIPTAEAAAKMYEGPESRSLGERCLIGFGGTGGPVMNNVLYNNTYQIVQSPGYALILVEMVHDARIIPITHDRKRPDAIKPWLGDSIGWYDGDTLVVETRNVNPEQKGYISENGTLTERFTRVGADEILYEFTVEDPSQYTQVWRGQMPMRTASGAVYEYACHEGNYGLVHILQGAREMEKRGEALELTADSE